MTDQLYRTRPVTENPTKDGYYILIDPEYPNLADGYYFMEGDWYESETEARVNENHDTLNVDGCFWLEIVTTPSPGDNQSLEDAARTKAKEYISSEFGDQESITIPEARAVYAIGFKDGAAYGKGGEEGLGEGLTKEQIAQICEMADNDFAGQEAIMFAEFLREHRMGANGFGGWGGGDININYYGSSEADLYKLFKTQQK